MRAEAPVLRADARRNRDKLIAAAREAFAGADDTVPLETIARRAGVGIGTLYRHFPTREALVEVVYAAEFEDVTTSAAALLATLPPAKALRAWMDRYARFAVTKHGMIDTLRTGWDAGRITRPSRERLNTEIAAILAAGAREGTLRDDVEPADITVMLLGVLMSTAYQGAPERIGRLLDLLLDALRPFAKGSNGERT